jgi:uncharacterized protein
MRLTSGLHPRVFADSSAYYATAVARDANHSAARTILERLERDRAQLFTTRYVLAETHALLIARRRDPAEALRVLTRIEESRGTTLVPTTGADELRAREILTQYQDHLFTLADALSFAVMERLRIPTAFTFDSDFAEYGFAMLTA